MQHVHVTFFMWYQHVHVHVHFARLFQHVHVHFARLFQHVHVCFDWRYLLLWLWWTGIWGDHHKENWASIGFWSVRWTCYSWTMQHGCWEVGRLPCRPGSVDQQFFQLSLIFLGIVICYLRLWSACWELLQTISISELNTCSLFEFLNFITLVF